MFTSKRKLFSSERGSATSWLAGITATALLIGAAALPAMAEEPVTTSEQQTVSETVEATAPAEETPATAEVPAAPAEEAPAEEAVIDEPIEDVAPADEPAATAEEAVIDVPIEDEAPDTDPSEQPAEETPAVVEGHAASDAPSETPTEDPGTTTSSTDGETPDANSPPVEDVVVATASPTIQSDKADYAAGSLVTLSGENWHGDDEVRIVTNDTLGKTWSRNVLVRVADDGTIVDLFSLPAYFVSDYDVTVFGMQSGRIATTTFTDTANYISINFAASDPDLYNHQTGGGVWANKLESLQGGDFICGDIVSYLTRIEVGTPSTPGSRTAVFQFDFALDSDGQSGTALGPVVGVGLNTAPTDSAVNGVATLDSWIQSNPTVVTPPYFTDNQAKNTLAVQLSGLDERDVVILRIDAQINCRFGDRPTGNLDARFAQADVTTPNDGPVPGGAQTVPLKSATDIIFPGRLVVDKVTDPTQDPTSFGFSVTAPGSANAPAYGPTTFNLTDQAAPWQSGNVDPSKGVLNGTLTNIAGLYTITETPTPGWASQLVCTSSGKESTFTYPNDRSAFVDLRQNETVTCIFTNTVQRGRILVDKVTDPAGSDTVFDFNPSWSDTDFTLTDAQAPHDSGLLRPGTYSVAELAEAGWDLTNSTCSNRSPVTAIVVSAGETVTCTFTNTQRGRILVDKVTDPAGSDTVFDFNPSWSDTDFTLTDAQAPHDSGLLRPGTYSVAELAEAGWDLTNSTCSNRSPVTAIVVSAGETVTCTFTNTQRGRILVDKVTDPAGSDTVFDFNPSWSDTDFTLTDAQAPHDSGLLRPGTYSVAELAEAGWDLTNSTCSNRSPVTAIVVSAGETVTCTFTNTQRGRILVDKVTDPAGSDTVFDFNPSWSDTDFTLTDAQAPHDSGLLRPGTYSVAELAEAGWDLTNSTCSNRSPVTAIVVSAGETVTCTFTNTRQKNLIILLKRWVNSATNDSAELTITGGLVDPAEATSISDGGSYLDDAKGRQASTLAYSGVEVSVSELLDNESNLGTYTSTLVCTVGQGEDQRILETNNGTFDMPNTAVTCTFTNNRNTGDLVIKKVVVGDIAGASTVFTVDVACGPESGFNYPGVVLNEANKWTATLTGINSGLSCVVTEGAVPAGWTLTSISPSPAVIGGTPVTVTVTNTRTLGDLVIKKVVVGPDAGVYD